ncbi:hypothetical protein [Albibacillus kandeliae]|uniref:hypothetical protein n=1 Tax=Albibacillus kandeliae TaxID=2174228 RepID=UPI000D697E62|nr:hypothetical protein [Albibacillus kandeliae]
MIRLISLLSALVLFAGCAAAPDPDAPLADLGVFRLGYNVVLADKARKGPVSRDATPEEWVAVLKPVVAKRFGRYQGNQLYHLGISVEGYALAPKGVPVLYNPKSALILNVTVFDDAAQQKLNPSPKQFTIYETTTQESFFLGSGRERTREEQMQGLARNAVHEIEAWMAEQRQAEGWFEPRAGAATEAVVDHPEMQAVSE